MPSTAYQGDRASPAAYKTATPDRFTFVHFTAHAAANLESPLDSAVILAGPDAAYKLYARDVADDAAARRTRDGVGVPQRR